MKFFKRKEFISTFIVITIALGTGILLNITQNNKQLISENDVRSQLEQMYDAEVTDVTKKQDVYKAVILKSGVVYVVEVNAVTGNVYSLEQTDEFVVEEFIGTSEESVESVTEETLAILEEPLLTSENTANSVAIVETVKLPTKIIITEKPKSSTTKSEATKTSKILEIISPKGVKSSQSIVQEKPVEEKGEKLITEVIKDAIKDVLKSEPSKIEEIKEAKPKEEGTKTEVAKTEDTKTEAVKTDSVKEEPAKTESSKKDEPKTEETQVTVVQSLTAQSEEKKTETVPKTEKATTILIIEDQAIKIAQQQIKGTVESSSFVKTNEGGYYLIVMKASLTESDSKDAAKAKQTKATIQVHAISGKVLSVTWE